MGEQLKVFTVEEANQLIPVLTELLTVLKEKHSHAVDLEAQIDALELVSNPDSDLSVEELNVHLEKHREAADDFYKIVDEIQSYGCFLKDAEMGLIDFYAVLEGKVVYLCWKLGERKVEHWHEIGKGYAFRQPLKSHAKDKGED